MSSEQYDPMMEQMALRHIIASLPPDAMRALTALTTSAMRRDDVSLLIGRLATESQFYAGASNAMSERDAISLQAFRYSIGRSTAAVHACIVCLEDRWPDMSEALRETITTETRQALHGGRGGEAVDARAWNAFLERVAPEPIAPGMR